MKQLLLIITFVFSFNLVAQIDFNNYKSIQSSGKIPKAFLTSSSQKTESDIDNISKKDNRKTKQRKKSFYLQSNFLVDELLLSGKVMFGDKLTNYVTKVAKEILKDDKATFNKLQFFTVKSPAVNAFATQQGIIFINIGLLAKLESEAELAFVLAHEISHFTENHVLDSYINTAELEDSYRKGNSLSYDDALLNKSNYSKEKELEADDLGFKLFKKSNYNQEKILDVFKMLKNSHLPFDLLEFDPNFISTDNYYINTEIEYDLEAIIKKSKKKRKRKNRRNAKNDEEEFESHPGTDERIEKLEDYVNDDGEEFLVSIDDLTNIAFTIIFC